MAAATTTAVTLATSAVAMTERGDKTRLDEYVSRIVSDAKPLQRRDILRGAEGEWQGLRFLFLNWATAIDMALGPALEKAEAKLQPLPLEVNPKAVTVLYGVLCSRPSSQSCLISVRSERIGSLASVVESLSREWLR